MVNQSEIISKYFPSLSKLQNEQIIALGDLYRSHNANVNVISRKDIDNIFIHHILHSMAIAKYISFKKDAMVCDLGTGGGLPGVPLAILFPETRFVLIDGTAKKITVANAIIEELGLDNCIGLHQRAEEFKQKFDFVVARAVTRLDKLVKLSLPLIAKHSTHALPNGLLTLKGGDLSSEIKELNKQYYVEEHALHEQFEEEFFQSKHLLYVQK